jgi:hypothetical protein
VCRAVDLNPALRKDLAMGHELQIDSDQLISTKVQYSRDVYALSVCPMLVVLIMTRVQCSRMWIQW